MQKTFLLFFLTAVTGACAQRGTIFFTSKEITRVDVNAKYHYSFDAYDSAGGKIFYSTKNLPAWLSYNKSSHSISGTSKKTGQYAIDIMAATKTGTTHQHFMLTVCNNQTANILCLGNSITNGVDTFNSYRRALWQMLHAANYNFDFIGSWSKHHMGMDVPDPDFDMDHEGHSGWTAGDIFNPPSWDSAKGNIRAWLGMYTPDIVLIELGTNDVFQCRKPAEILNDFKDAVDLLRRKNNHIKIFIAQIPPFGAQWSSKKLCGNDTSYALAITNLNKNIAAFTAEYSTDQSPVIAVDQFTGVNPATDMFDDIHPNTKGEKVMAERWFAAIKPYLGKL